MKRLIPLLAATFVIAAAALATAVGVGASGGGAEKSASQAEDSSGGVPGVAAMCAKDVPDCNDTALGGGGSGTVCIQVEGADCAVDLPLAPDEVFCSVNGEFAVCDPAVPACVGTQSSEIAADVSCDPSGPVDGGGGTSSLNTGSSEPGTGAVMTFDITVPFDATVTDDDTKLANEIVLAFDPNASFLIQESFPPTGRATLTSSDLDLCAAMEPKLESIPSVGDVTCSPSASVNPPCCKPDAPVSSTPAGEPGVNPSALDSAPSSGPTLE